MVEFGRFWIQIPKCHYKKISHSNIVDVILWLVMKLRSNYKTNDVINGIIIVSCTGHNLSTVQRKDIIVASSDWLLQHYARLRTTRIDTIAASVAN